MGPVGIVLCLAFVQFSHIMDFMVMMPLGPQLMRTLGLGAHEFSLLVSVYTGAAAVSCLLATLVMDRFDRRPVLLSIYSGLVIGTFLCGIAPNFPTLLCARTVTGIFGGLLQAIILAIIHDVVPTEKQGAATGVVMAAFAVASVVGVPASLAVATRFGWQAPFLAIGSVSLVNLGLATVVVPRVRSHLSGSAERQSGPHPLVALLGMANTWKAFLLIVTMMTVFAIFPFIGPFVVSRLGIAEGHLPSIYLASGLAGLVASPLIGRLADQVGPRLVFSISSVLSALLILVFSRLDRTTLSTVIILNTMISAIGVGRLGPSMNLINSMISQRQRGGFMTLVAAVQQLSASGASYLGGLMLDGSSGLANFPAVGTFAAVSMFVSVGVCYTFRPLVDEGSILESKPALVESSSNS